MVWEGGLEWSPMEVMGKVFGEGGTWNGSEKLSKRSSLRPNTDFTTLAPITTVGFPGSPYPVECGCLCLPNLCWNHLLFLYVFSESRPCEACQDCSNPLWRVHCLICDLPCLFRCNISTFLICLSKVWRDCPWAWQPCEQIQWVNCIFCVFFFLTSQAEKPPHPAIKQNSLFHYSGNDPSLAQQIKSRGTLNNGWGEKW